MTTKRLLPIAAALVVIAGSVVIAHQVWHTPAPPAPKPKAQALLSCAPAPVTFTDNTVFAPPAGSCFNVPNNGIVLRNLSHVTINGDGSELLDANVLPCPFSKCAPGTKGRPAIRVVGGSDDLLENFKVAGANTGGEHLKLAFNAGIELEGTTGTVISNVAVNHPEGDGLDLEPMRSGTGSNGIVQPVTDLTVTDFSTTAAGRNGISCTSVNGATFTDTTIGTTGQDSVDCESDQNSGEGAKNLTFNGAQWSGLFSINSGGRATGPITVNDLTMPAAGSGDALNVENRDGTPDAGPITIEHSAIRSGQSSDRSCLQLNGATVVMLDDTINIGFAYKGAIPTPVYHAVKKTTLTFSGTTVSGVYKRGTVDSTSKVVNPVGRLGP